MMPQSAPGRNDECDALPGGSCGYGELAPAPGDSVVIHSLQNLAGIEQTVRISGPDRRGAGADGAIVSENANMSHAVGAQDALMR